MTELTQKFLRERFVYKNDDLYWRTPGKNRDLTKPVGTPSSSGYRQICLYLDDGSRSNQLVHRLIYLYHYGTVPKIIDHRDNNPFNNAIENLRPATQAENCLNRKICSRNKSGAKGVSWCKNTRRWVVQLYKNRRLVFKRRFEDFELACFVAGVMRDTLHNSFARHK